MASDGLDRAVSRALERFEQHYGGIPLPSPARHDQADYHCPNCETDVRGITDGDRVLACPCCGETPGALVIGRGPKKVTA